jgi:hypothetical protein
MLVVEKRERVSSWDTGEGEEGAIGPFANC